ncbi:MAG: cupin domain-containing protein [Pseudomonadota bacterium]
MDDTDTNTQNALFTVAKTLSNTAVYARATGTMQQQPITEDFWEESVKQLNSGYLITLHTIKESWHHWERHSAGDEFIFVLSGNMDLLIQNDSTTRNRLSKGGFALLKRGAWHTVEVANPVEALFVTWGQSTEYREK